MKRVGLLIVVLALCSTAAMATQFGIRGGYYGNDIKKGFVGAELVFPFGSLAINGQNLHVFSIGGFSKIKKISEIVHVNCVRK